MILLRSQSVPVTYLPAGMKTVPPPLSAQRSIPCCSAAVHEARPSATAPKSSTLTEACPRVASCELPLPSWPESMSFSNSILGNPQGVTSIQKLTTARMSPAERFEFVQMIHLLLLRRVLTIRRGEKAI